MKFACEHCGRSYAVADELRGKTFKMKCKACGHVIVVKGIHATDPAGKARGASGKAEPTPSPVTIPGAPPGDEPAARPPAIPEVNPFVARPVSTASLGTHGAGSHRDEPDDPGLPPPPTEQYIELVIDEEKAGAEARERQAPPRPPPRRDGPGLQDPFADWKGIGEMEKGPLAEPVEPHPLRPPPEPPGARAAPPRARREPWPEAPAPSAPAPEGLNPKVLLVAGGVAVVAVAVLLFVYVGRGGKAPGPSAPVNAQPAPLAVPSAPVAAQPRPAPPPAAVEPIPAVAEAEPAREEEPPRRRAEPAQRKPKPVKVAREERRPEPKAEPPRRAPQPSPEPPPEPPPRPASVAPTATPSASAEKPKAAGQLTPQQIGKIVTANRRAFEQCIAEAGKRDPGLDLAGRQVTLMLTVNSNGKVAYPTIDDVELNKTDLGSCIKSAARIMIFPSFEGEPMKVEVPLTLGR